MFGTLIGLVGLEIVMRCAGSIPMARNPLSGFHIGDPHLGWRGVSNFVGRFRSNLFDAVVEHNAEGFRAADPAFDGPSDRPRAVFLGDSFVWGWGVAQGESFTDLLQTSWQGRTEVVNRGVNAYGTTQQLILLKQLVETNPKTVTLLFCVNDSKDCIEGKRGLRPYSSLEDGELVLHNYPVQRSISTWFRTVRRHSLAISMVTYHVNRLGGQLKAWMKSSPSAPADTPDPDPSVAPGPKTAPADPPGFKVCEALLAEMQRVCKEHQPAIELRVVYIAELSDLKGEVNQPASASINGLRMPLARACKRAGIAYLDLTEAFERGIAETQSAGGDIYDLFIEGDHHWTAKGHAIAAKAIESSFKW